MLRGRVLITGGAGFLGRGILRRASNDGWPCEFIVYSRDEQKQYLCKKKYPDARYVLGDIRDDQMLRALLMGVDTVIHTAAMKYIPEGEVNVSESISVNIGGTRNLMECARWADVQNIVIISTDKAVAPVNVYGMTKALCERMVGESAMFSGPKVTGVRYGNVVGSTGSVIPKLLDDAANMKVVTLTDPDMTRFWISIDEAIDLILMALDEDVLPGSLIIPTPTAMTLASLCAALVPDVDINVVGPRPGERKHELLLTRDESRWVRGLDKLGYPITTNNVAMHELVALSQRGQPTDMAFQLSSETADRMSAVDMCNLVADAENV